VNDLVDYRVQFDPARRESVISGWAAAGPTYPAAVFASVDGIRDFQQFENFTTAQWWERQAGRSGNDDMRTLGFTARFSERLVAPMLDAGRPVTVRLKIAAFDLSGYYSAPYSYRVAPNRTTITKIPD
jgi:hypothetical protein